MRRLTIILLLVMTACKGGEALKDAGQLRKASASTKVPVEKPSSVSTGADDGTLDCSARVVGTVLRHDSSLKAFQNLHDNSANAATVVLIGHGAAGTICTGEGATCSSANTRISDVVADWEQAVALLSDRPNVTTIRLVGCGVGAGTFGSQLLHNMANKSGRTVIAPISSVFCRNGRLELDKPGWHTERPGGAGGPPEYNEFGFVKQNFGRFVDLDGQLVPVKLDDVAPATFRPFSPDGVLMPPIKFDAVKLPMGDIDFAEPFDPLGYPLAIVTSQLKLQVKIKGKIVLKTFDVLSDELLRDVDSPNTYYRSGKPFTERLRDIRMSGAR